METIRDDQAERDELSSMIATLCSYENWLGPFHSLTLRLLTEVASAYSRVGETAHAMLLLERAIRDVGRYMGPNHDLRLQALATLRDLLIHENDTERAGAVQKELLHCRRQRLGADHPDTLATQADLAIILWNTVEPMAKKEV